MLLYTRRQSYWLFFKPSTREKPRSVYILYLRCSIAWKVWIAVYSLRLQGQRHLFANFNWVSVSVRPKQYSLPKKDASCVYSFTPARKGRREKCDPNGIIYGDSESSCTPPPTTSSIRRERRHSGWPLQMAMSMRACSLQQLHLISLKSSRPASVPRIFYRALVCRRCKNVPKQTSSVAQLCSLKQTQPTNSSWPPGCARAGKCAPRYIYVTVCAKLLLSLQATWKYNTLITSHFSSALDLNIYLRAPSWIKSCSAWATPLFVK